LPLLVYFLIELMKEIITEYSPATWAYKELIVLIVILVSAMFIIVTLSTLRYKE
jgi:hypothetical protein